MDNGNGGADRDFELWLLPLQAHNAVTRARENELRPIGLSTVQAGVLWIVKTLGTPPSPAEISRWLLRRPHTVSELLDRMEMEGLVLKIGDGNRRNGVKVVLTEKGEEAYQRSRDMGSIHTILSSLSKEERASLGTCLQTLRNSALKTRALQEVQTEQQSLFP